MRKPTICVCENADQVHGNSEADQRLCFCYTDSTLSLLLKSQISSLLLRLYSLVCVRPVRKPHFWFSHDFAHILVTKPVQKYQNSFGCVLIDVQVF